MSSQHFHGKQKSFCSNIKCSYAGRDGIPWSTLENHVNSRVWNKIMNISAMVYTMLSSDIIAVLWQHILLEETISTSEVKKLLWNAR